jgi:hypothetical protein
MSATPRFWIEADLLRLLSRRWLWYGQISLTNTVKALLTSILGDYLIVGRIDRTFSVDISWW